MREEFNEIYKWIAQAGGMLQAGYTEDTNEMYVAWFPNANKKTFFHFILSKDECEIRQRICIKEVDKD